MDTKLYHSKFEPLQGGAKRRREPLRNGMPSLPKILLMALLAICLTGTVVRAQGADEPLGEGADSSATGEGSDAVAAGEALPDVEAVARSS